MYSWVHLFFLALMGVDLRKPWVDQVHLKASKTCSVSEIRILSSGMHLHEDNSHCAPKINVFGKKEPCHHGSIHWPIFWCQPHSAGRCSHVEIQSNSPWIDLDLQLRKFLRLECLNATLSLYQVGRQQRMKRRVKTVAFQTWILMLGRTRHFLKQSSNWSWSNLWWSLYSSQILWQFRKNIYQMSKHHTDVWCLVCHPHCHSLFFVPPTSTIP